MTAEEKALAVIKSYAKLPLREGTREAMECQAMAQLQCLIADALKDQDRATRQSCAEAVIALNGIIEGPPFDTHRYIKADEAHAACINANGFSNP